MKHKTRKHKHFKKSFKSKKHYKNRSKSSFKECKPNMSYDECEIEILRNAVDRIEKEQGRKVVMSPEIKEIIQIVEQFLIKKKRVCYGGTAINNILPIDDQFYDKEIEIPDYDFFSPEALKDAKDLADIYFKLGFTDVEAKAGVHHGTFKVFVNFIPVADITQLPKKLYKSVFDNAIKIAGIHYASPDYLRMSMYLELSRPKGDVSRWEKVLKRLTLLNKNYPLKGKDCNLDKIQRSMERLNKQEKNNIELIFHTVRDSFINQGLVFFGGMANSLYMKYLKHGISTEKIPDFDVLSENPEQAATIVKERLQDEGIKNIKIDKHAGVGEIVAPHYEIRVDNDTIAFIYEPLGCHSYNMITIDGKKARIATIDTMLSFYLAFIYADLPYYDPNRILCMSEYLFKVQQENRLKQKGLLKRFNMDCYGDQITLESTRKEKTKKYKELKNKKGTKEYEEWFLKYIPAEMHSRKERNHNKTQKNKHHKKRNKTNKNSMKRNIIKTILRL
jgi:hypothetical protein